MVTSERADGDGLRLLALRELKHGFDDLPGQGLAREASCLLKLCHGNCVEGREQTVVHGMPPTDRLLPVPALVARAIQRPKFCWKTARSASTSRTACTVQGTGICCVC